MPNSDGLPSWKRDNWWTPMRVASMLDGYASICELLDGDGDDGYGSPSGWLSDGSGGGGWGSPAWCHLVEVRADLERAISTLPPRLKLLALQRWRHCHDVTEMGRTHHVAHQRISVLLAQAADRIEAILVRGVAR